jgi:tetratricopeptide (TPR) repeat protein
MYTLLVLVLIAGAFYGGLRASDYVKQRLSIANANVASDPLQNGREAFEKADYRVALAEFESLSKRDPSNARALYWLGRAQLELRDYEAAAKSFEEVTTRQPSMHDAYVQQAAAYEAMGDKPRAAAALSRYAEERRKNEH